MVNIEKVIIVLDKNTAETVRKVDIDNLYKMTSLMSDNLKENSSIVGTIEVDTCKETKKDFLESVYNSNLEDKDFTINLTGNDGGIIADPVDSDNERAIVSLFDSYKLLENLNHLIEINATTAKSVYFGNNSQVINTGYIPKSNTRILTKIRFTESVNNLKIFGCYESNKNAFLLYIDLNSKFATLNSNQTRTYESASTNKEYTIEYDNSSVIINGNLWSNPYSGDPLSLSIFIGNALLKTGDPNADHNGFNNFMSDSNFKGYIYYFTIYEGENLILDLRPIIADTISEKYYYKGGFYDTITGKAYLTKVNTVETADTPSSIKVKVPGFLTVLDAQNISNDYIGNKLGWRYTPNSIFYNQTDITDLTCLQYFNKIIFIGENAFRGCTNLKTIKFPSSLIDIAGNRTSSGSNGYPFRDCSLLETIDASEVLYIGPKAFQYCTALTNINISKVIGGGYRNWGWGYNWTYQHADDNHNDQYVNAWANHILGLLSSCAFEGCTSLENITIPDTITKIAPYAFNNCTSLSLNLLPTNVTEIGQCAFYHSNCNFSELPDNVYLKLFNSDQSNVINLNFNSDFSNISLDWPYVIDRSEHPNGIFNKVWFGNYYDDSTPANSLYPQTYPLYNNLYFCYVGNGANKLTESTNKETFSDSNLQVLYDTTGSTITLLNNLQITQRAFYNDTDLKAISGFSAIGPYAFYGCTKLQGTIDCGGTNEHPIYLWKYAFSKSGISEVINASICPTQLNNATYLFAYCQNLTSISNNMWEIFDGCETIPEYCFYRSGLSGDLTIKEGFTTYNRSSCFEHCYNLTGTIYIPEVITISGKNIFNVTNATRIEFTSNSDTINSMTITLNWIGANNNSEIVYPLNTSIYVTGDGKIASGTTKNINAELVVVLGDTSSKDPFNDNKVLKHIKFEHLLSFGGRLRGGIKLFWINLSSIPSVTTPESPYIKFYVPANKYSDYINDSSWGSLANRIVGGEPNKKQWYGVDMFNFTTDSGNRIYKRGYYDMGAAPTATSLFYLTIECINTSQLNIFGCAQNNYNSCKLMVSGNSNSFEFCGIGGASSWRSHQNALQTKHSYICDILNTTMYYDLNIYENWYSANYIKPEYETKKVPLINMYLGACNTNGSAASILHDYTIYNFVWIDNGKIKQVWKGNENGGFDIYSNDTITLLGNSTGIPINDVKKPLSLISLVNDLTIDILEAKTKAPTDSSLLVYPGESITFDCITDSSVPIFDWSTTLTDVNSFRGSLYYVTIPNNTPAGDYTITATTITDTTITNIASNTVSASYTVKVPEPTSLSINASPAGISGNVAYISANTDGAKNCDWQITHYPPGATVSLTNDTSSASCILNYSNVSVGDEITIQATYSHNSVTLTASTTITVIDSPTYIKLDGNSYFNTGYKPTANTTVKVKFKSTAAPSGTYETIVGGEDSKDGADGRSLMIEKSNPSIFKSSGKAGPGFTIDTLYTATLGLSSFTINAIETSLGYTQRQACNTATLYIGTLNRTGGDGAGVGQSKNNYTGQIYYVYIYESGELTKQYIPWATNQIKEVLSGTIINNSGSGTASVAYE